jgi:hypothetical protein
MAPSCISLDEDPTWNGPEDLDFETSASKRGKQKRSRSNSSGSVCSAPILIDKASNRETDPLPPLSQGGGPTVNTTPSAGSTLSPKLTLSDLSITRRTSLNNSSRPAGGRIPASTTFSVRSSRTRSGRKPTRTPTATAVDSRGNTFASRKKKKQTVSGRVSKKAPGKKIGDGVIRVRKTLTAVWDEEETTVTYVIDGKPVEEMIEAACQHARACNVPELTVERVKRRLEALVCAMAEQLVGLKHLALEDQGTRQNLYRKVGGFIHRKFCHPSASTNIAREKQIKLEMGKIIGKWEGWTKSKLVVSDDDDVESKDNSAKSHVDGSDDNAETDANEAKGDEDMVDEVSDEYDGDFSDASAED